MVCQVWQPTINYEAQSGAQSVYAELRLLYFKTHMFGPIHSAAAKRFVCFLHCRNCLLSQRLPAITFLITTITSINHKSQSTPQTQETRHHMTPRCLPWQCARY